MKASLVFCSLLALPIGAAFAADSESGQLV
jgi:hypothetical protein